MLGGQKQVLHAQTPIRQGGMGRVSLGWYSGLSEYIQINYFNKLSSLNPSPPTNGASLSVKFIFETASLFLHIF